MLSFFRRNAETPEPQESLQFVDVHCHMLFGIDDGSKSPEESLEMARMAVEDGISTVVLTPHQLGSFRNNTGDTIRARVAEFQELLDEHQIALRVLPGADVRIEPDMLALIQAGQVVTLGDHRRHVLLELPHEIYFPLEPVLEQLHAASMVGILSHPERNQGLLRDPRHLAPLVEMGCLMQVTCGSLTGTFGPASQQMSEWMLDQGMVHILATDAHGARARRPLMNRAYQIATRLVGPEVANRMCCSNPAAIAEGRDIGDAGRSGRRSAARSTR